jgi:hypothetical protein
LTYSLPFYAGGTGSSSPLTGDDSGRRLGHIGEMS